MNGPQILAALLLSGLTALGTRAMGAVTFSAPATHVDGRTADHLQFPKSEAAVNFRPQSASEKALTVQNYSIHNLINQKGLDIRATQRGNNLPAWAYQTITVKNLRLSNIERREDLPGGNGLHIDHIRIGGGGSYGQDVKMNILIENVEIDGGDALPILVTDGDYGTITLRNVTIKNTTLNNAQFKTDKVGSIERIIIDNSPGIGVALIGRPGSIGEVLVRNSPGIRLGDTVNASGRSGAAISYLDALSDHSGSYLSTVATHPSGAVSLAIPALAPEPGGLGAFAFAVLILLRRSR